MLTRSFLHHTDASRFGQNSERLPLIHMPIDLINENEIFPQTHVVMTE